MVMLYIFLVSLFPSAWFPVHHANSNTHHPYYISVTEVEYIAAEKEIGIACKIFADDFEHALKDMYNVRVDIYNPADKTVLGKQIKGYIQKHLQLKADQKTITLQYLGFETEGEAAWCYFSAKEIAPVKTVEVFNDLLYEYKKEQINFLHVKIKGNRKSGRLSYPDNKLVFDF